MNQVEQWFSILQRKRLRIADFTDKKHVSQRLMAFVAEWNEHAHPFHSTLAISSGRGKLIEEDFPLGAVKYYLIRVRARVVQIFSCPNGASDEGQHV